MKRRFENLALAHRLGLAVALGAFSSACTKGRIDGGTSGDASASDAAHRPTEASAPKSDASKPRGKPDASRPRGSPEAAAPDAARPGDGGRDFGTNRNDFFGPTRCAAANVQLCEDFESGTIDTGTWDVTGKPTIDGVQKARGNRAMHIVQAGDGFQSIREKKTFPEKDNTYWGRVFVYFEQLPAAPMTYAHWTFVAAAGTGVSGEIRLSAQFSNGNNLFGVGTDNRTDTDGTGDWTMSDKDPGGTVPLHKWLCIEWLHAGGIDVKINETRFFVDGVEHPSLHTTATMNGGNGKPYILPEFTNVWLGWWEYQASTEPFELWMDEVAIDSARIGCVL